MSREWVCNYCLEVTEGERPPQECPACHVGFCACQTRLKSGSKWCFGCGAIKPDIRARFTCCSSTGSVYMTENWARSGLSEGRTAMYGVSRGWGWDKPVDMEKKPPRTWLTVEDNGERQDVRLLTPEEESILGYEHWTPEAWAEYQRTKPVKG